MSNIKWIMDLIRPNWKECLLSIFLTTLRALLLLCPPFLTQYIIDHTIPQESPTLLILSSIGIVSIPILTGIIIIWDLKVTNFVLKIGAQYRVDLYDSIQYRPLDWFKSFKMGDVVNRLTEESKAVATFGYFGLGTYLWFVATIIIGIGLMSTIEWRLTLGVIVLLCCQFWFFSKMNTKVKVEANSLISSEANIVENLRETISGIYTIKQGAQEASTLEKLNKQLDSHVSVYKKYIITDSKSDLIFTLFVALMNALLYFVGGVLVISGDLTLGSLIALLSLFLWIQPMVYYFQYHHLSAIRHIPYINRIREIFKPVTLKKSDIIPEEPFDIEFNNVSFSYKENVPILQNLHFTISQGETAAITGSSGSGKSTLINLLLNFYEPDSGKIFLGGQPLNMIENSWLRKNVVCISQQVQMRPGTVYDNLAYYSPDSTIDDIREAIEIAGLSEFINKLPNGLDTDLGEDTLQISGGEQQRISIARAIICKPKILIMDEATSALDNITEKNILTKLRNYLPTSTILTVTHREAVLKYSNKIYNLRKNELLEHKF
jgi:ABC-type bacteriocin/lantibiotic exporter with double-glycine peptidase domain